MDLVWPGVHILIRLLVQLKDNMNCRWKMVSCMQSSAVKSNLIFQVLSCPKTSKFYGSYPDAFVIGQNFFILNIGNNSDKSVRYSVLQYCRVYSWFWGLWYNNCTSCHGHHAQIIRNVWKEERWSWYLLSALFCAKQQYINCYNE